MNDKERRVSKYLPFDALKGLMKEVEKKNNSVFIEEFPELSEDQRIEMDSVLLECYSFNKVISFWYYEKGRFNFYSGIIEKIDVINKEIILLPKKRFSINRIKEVAVK